MNESTTDEELNELAFENKLETGIGELFQDSKDQMEKTIRSYELVVEKIRREQNHLKKAINELSKKSQLVGGGRIDPKAIMQLYQQPYIIVDTGKPDTWKVVAWRGVDFSVGWLESSNDSFNIFLVNKYASYLGEIPEDLSERFHFKPTMDLKIFDGMLLTGIENQDKAWERYSKQLLRREGDDRIRIKKGCEFDLIAQMISDGILPFRPRPVSKDDLQLADIDLSLRDYQQDAWDHFLEKGAIGVYWAPGAGKTFLGLWALAHLKGRKLVVVPSVVLREQWKNRIRAYLGSRALLKIDVETYHSHHKVNETDYKLTIYDECHHLPANTFSKLGTIKTKYRIGLSATPYREDGRTNYIFALTGFPVGLRWDVLFKQGLIKKPDIIVYLVRTEHAKIIKLEELLQEKSKTIVFCDRIATGERLEKRFGYPFVSGETKAEDRIPIIKNSQITFVSRVGDEGLSLEDIERVIEIAHHGKSKRQALQRAGRVLHSNVFLQSKKRAKHIVLLTDEEFNNEWAERSKPYREKGFKIDIIRG